MVVRSALEGHLRRMDIRPVIGTDEGEIAIVLVRASSSQTDSKSCLES